MFKINFNSSKIESNILEKPLAVITPSSQKQHSFIPPINNVHKIQTTCKTTFLCSLGIFRDQIDEILLAHKLN
jgi:hypothetical protein